MKLTRKGYARIYVDNENDIPLVRDIIRELDPFEFDYLPDDMIADFSEYPTLAYTNKFDDLDMNLLTATCWSRDIKIWVLDNAHNECINKVVKNLNKI